MPVTFLTSLERIPLLHENFHLRKIVFITADRNRLRYIEKKKLPVSLEWKDITDNLYLPLKSI